LSWTSYFSRSVTTKENKITDAGHQISETEIQMISLPMWIYLTQCMYKKITYGFKTRLKVLTSWFWKPWPHKFPCVVHTNLTFKTYGIAKNMANNQAPEINPYRYLFPVVTMYVQKNNIRVSCIYNYISLFNFALFECLSVQSYVKNSTLHQQQTKPKY
jgi:hypothetical protein